MRVTPVQWLVLSLFFVFLPVLFARGKKEKDPLGRSVAPDIWIEGKAFFFDMRSYSKFGGGDFVNLQDALGLERFGSFLGGEVYWLYSKGFFSLGFSQSLVVNHSEGAAYPVNLQGQLFSQKVPLRLSQRVSRLEGRWGRSLLPPAVTGLRIYTLLSAQFLHVSQKIASQSGNSVRLKFGTFLPLFGLRFEYDLWFAEPERPEEVFLPRPSVSLAFQVEGIAFLDYSLRRVAYDYEVLTGILIHPAEFFTLSLLYRLWEFHVIKPRGKLESRILWEGFSLSFILKF